jgi:hypothetical protein
MALMRKSGICKICKRSGRTDWHHIISQHHAIKTGQTHLLDNPDNVIEICRRCHNQTTASMVRKRLTRKYGRITSGPPRKHLTPQEKRALREKKQKEKEKIIEESMRKIVARGGGLWIGKYRPSRAMEKFRQVHGGDVFGVEIENLYPPDHWLHSPERYSSSLSKRFERDWMWTLSGGAFPKSRLKRYSPEKIAKWMKN